MNLNRVPVYIAIKLLGLGEQQASLLMSHLPSGVDAINPTYWWWDAVALGADQHLPGCMEALRHAGFVPFQGEALAYDSAEQELVFRELRFAEGLCSLESAVSEVTPLKEWYLHSLPPYQEWKKAVWAYISKTDVFPVYIAREVLEMPIEELILSVRAYNALKRANLVKLGQLLDKTGDELLHIRNFSDKALDELKNRLIALGISVPKTWEPLEEEGEKTQG